MDFIHDAWPGARTLPRLHLGQFPTPVKRLETLSEQSGIDIWCKYDNTTSPIYGGNKVRKLEWLLADARARGRDTIITTGALGSHHVLATSLLAKKENFDVHAVMVPQPWNDHVERNLRVVIGSGATVHPVTTFKGVVASMLKLSAKLRLKGKRPYMIGPGGSSPVGALGFVEAALELARQIEQRECPEPDAIFVTLGSGGTVAGLSVGLAAIGISSKIFAVRVTDKTLMNKKTLSLLVARTSRLLERSDNHFPDVTRLALSNIEVRHDQFGAGYGIPTDAARIAMTSAHDTQNLELDPTYTSKTFAALLDYTTSAHSAARISLPPTSGERPASLNPAVGLPYKTVLYWHTLSDVDLQPLVETAPPIPPAILSFSAANAKQASQAKSMLTLRKINP